jgi:hypothetical protein
LWRRRDAGATKNTHSLGYRFPNFDPSRWIVLGDVGQL